jgi:hypothetical protein
MYTHACVFLLATPDYTADGNHPSKPDSQGAPEGTIPDTLNQSVGQTHLENVALSKGSELFGSGPALGYFGTFDAPFKVLSSFPERIVGCVGAGDRSHHLQWFNLTAGKKHVCHLCGQFFELTNDANDITQQHDDLEAGDRTFYDAQYNADVDVTKKPTTTQSA